MTPSMSHRIRWLRGCLGVLLCGLGLVACQAKQPSSQPFVCEHPVNGCAIAFQAHSLQLRFDQTPRPLKPFRLDIQSERPLKAVHARLAMEGMDMGLNQYQLIRVAPNHWQAEIILPVCIRGRADWRLELTLTTEQGVEVYQTNFLSQP